MQQWMSLLWLFWITMFIARQEMNGLKSCGSNIQITWSQNISWGHLCSFNFIGPACWKYRKMVLIWAILHPRKLNSNAICNVRRVKKMSPRRVGERNQLFEKTYEGLISRLEVHLEKSRCDHLVALLWYTGPVRLRSPLDSPLTGGVKVFRCFVDLAADYREPGIMRFADEMRHPGGARTRATAFPYREESAEISWACSHVVPYASF